MRDFSPKRLTNTWVRAGILAFLLIFGLAVSANAGTMMISNGGTGASGVNQ
ncbi:MAG: hypothetical protein WCT39_00845 [Candidatus Margulisiibacteriota bacterium]